MFLTPGFWFRTLRLNPSVLVFAEWTPWIQVRRPEVLGLGRVALECFTQPLEEQGKAHGSKHRALHRVQVLKQSP